MSNDIAIPINKTVQIKDHKLRAYRITIDVIATDPDGKPPADIAGAERMVVFEVEGRDRDENGYYVGKPVRTYPNVYRKVNMATLVQALNLRDPVTNDDMYISMAGVAAAIENFFVKWYNEDEAARAKANIPTTPSEE